MHYCRHCQKPTMTETGPCPHCGKELSDSIPLETLDESEGQGSDSSRQIDPTTGEFMPSGGGHGEVDLGMDDSGSIELGFDPQAEKAAREKPVAPVPGKVSATSPGTTRTAPTSAAGAPQEDEIANISGYGQPPDSFFQTAGYMFHVRKRRKALGEEIARLEKDVAQAAEDLDADLLKIGTRKEDEAVEQGEFGREVEAIHEKKQQVARFRQQREIEDKDKEGKLGYIDEEISRLEVEAEKFKNEEGIISREAEDAYASRKRVQLKLQRVEIEIRNIKESMPRSKKGEPPISPDVLAPFESKIAEREASIREIKGELESAENVVKEINKKLAMARNAVSEQMGKISLANKKKKDVLENARATEQRSQEQFFDLQQKLEECYRDLAREALEAEKLPSGMADMAAVIAQKTDALQGLKAKLELYRTAIESYSHSDFTKGHVLLGSIGGLVLLLLILILIIVF